MFIINDKAFFIFMLAFSNQEFNQFINKLTFLNKKDLKSKQKTK